MPGGNDRDAAHLRREILEFLLMQQWQLLPIGASSALLKHFFFKRNIFQHAVH